MLTKAEILGQFQLFVVGTGGIGKWLSSETDDDVFTRLATIDQDPLSKVQFDQLLLLAHEAGVSDDFFDYYFLNTAGHPYDVTSITGYQAVWTESGNKEIRSLEHLKWGLRRLYTDGLLYFGNVRAAYRVLRTMTESQLRAFFHGQKVDTEAVKRRGPPLRLAPISKDDRYLISEQACKSYGMTPETTSELKEVLVKAWEEHQRQKGGRIPIRSLLDGSYVKSTYADRQPQFLFSADDILDVQIGSISELESKYGEVARAFQNARAAALKNTKLYLSMVNDLDVYVATSMRTRQDFRDMAKACEQIFGDRRLKDLHVRYFDPTMSAAEGHEDKGLIECLMVKCARALVYCAGSRDSYGKDAEAAMALSLGKPVIFYCDHEQRTRFYRDVHPLSRLIEFDTGIAVGAMVTDRIEDVSELLVRIFENRMEYELSQPRPGYLRLIEKLTKSVVRLQTSNELLMETFWNYYQNQPRRSAEVTNGLVEERHSARTNH
jgi:hypothetical protein